MADPNGGCEHVAWERGQVRDLKPGDLVKNAWAFGPHDFVVVSVEDVGGLVSLVRRADGLARRMYSATKIERARCCEELARGQS